MRGEMVAKLKGSFTKEMKRGSSHVWDVKSDEQLSEIRLPLKSRKVNYERVRIVIAQIKEMMKNEKDRTIKITLAHAGLELNKLLLK